MDDWKSDWSGTKKELTITLKEIMDNIRCTEFEEISEKDFNKLFLEAMCRNLVQSEISSMINYILTGK